MKQLAFSLALILFANFLFGQNLSTKTKILLIGTVHFETPHTDKFELETDNFLEPKRQKELEELTKNLLETKADKVMIERQSKDQDKIDSLYNAYLTNKYNLTVSEREQIGFRLAKKLKLKAINCIDADYSLHDSLMSVTAKNNNQLYLLEKLGEDAKTLLGEVDNKVKSSSITETLKFINRPDLLQRNLSLYLKYFAKIGAGNNFAGAEFVSEWYLRNLGIYANILNQVKPTDKFIIVIFGQGHIPILQHFFQNNDDYELIEVNSVLK
ncbi:hypothetical protein GS399_03750 [Pedobacter sp. HMF7647]|uniref:TraB/GumN family protein n=1 Tax=Hufsiella arboris TaxID=2695275 RepID=A0A7K1Y666_9SPHI|nr:DUF5694 domain-containing protein [Hufsiella arboris]MXV50074.1 hypothetical protein [Hufsiella arboris]